MILTCPQCATRYRVNGAAFAPPGRQVRCKKCQYSWFQAPPAEEELALVDDVAETPPVIKRPLPPPPPPLPPAPPVTAPTQVLAPETAIASAIRKAEVHAEEAPAQPVPQPAQPMFKPLPVAPAEDQEPVQARPFPPQPNRPSPQNRAPPPFRAQPQTFQPAQPSRFKSGALQIGAIVIWVGVFLFIGSVIGSAILYRYEIIRTWRPAATIYSLFGFDVNVTGLVFNVPIDQVEVVGNELVIRGDIQNVSSEEQPIPKVRAILRDKDNNPVFEWTFDIKTERIAPGAKVPLLTKIANPPPTANQVEMTFAPLDE